MDEIKDALKELRVEQKTIRESQIRMSEDLRHHIKRSDQLEKLVELQEARVSKQVSDVGDKVSKIELPYKISLYVLAAAGVIVLVQQLYAIFK